jgi:poly(A) polymerase
LDHAIESVGAAGFLIRQGQWLYGDPACLNGISWSDDLDRYFCGEVVYGSTQAALLKLAALLHDIAKPDTKILAGEKIRFFGHDKQGADIVSEILERLRFSKKEIDLVEKMVRFHMRPTQIGHEDVPSRRAIFRYFRHTGDVAISVLFLSLADHLAARGPNLDAQQWRWHVNQVNFILNAFFNQQDTVYPPKLVDGYDLMRIFDLKPGPELREILDSIKEAQAGGEIVTRDEALSYVKNRLLYRKQNLEG